MHSLRTLVLILVTAGIAAAQTSWTGTASDAFADPANWSAGVPTATVDATIPSGTPNAPRVANAGQAVRTLVVDGNATLEIAAGVDLAVFGSLTVTGAITGGGRVSMEGADGTVLAGSGPLPGLRIAKTVNTRNVTVQDAPTVTGSLELTGGTLFTATPAILTVQGDATFAGGQLSSNIDFSNNNDIGEIWVSGNVTFTGTTASGTQPDLFFAGDLTSDGTYDPTSSRFVANGTAQQTIGGAAPRANGLFVESGSSVRLTSTVVFRSTLSVLGTLTTDVAFDRPAVC